MNLKDVPTNELVEELIKREGVESHKCSDPDYRDYILIEKLKETTKDRDNPRDGKYDYNSDWEYVFDHQRRGPCIILRIID